MCGISGIVVLQSSSYSISKEVLLQMNRALFHRGPNVQAIYCNDTQDIGFAFTRLSLLDAKNGTQLMKNRDGSIVLVYKGEIYDDQSWKKSLQKEALYFNHIQIQKYCCTYIKNMVYKYLNN